MAGAGKPECSRKRIGCKPQPRLAEAISVARETSTASLEEMEKEWNVIPAAMDGRGYGFDAALTEPEDAREAAHEPAKKREQELNLGM